MKQQTEQDDVNRNNEQELFDEVRLVISEINGKREAVRIDGHELKRSSYGNLEDKGLMDAKSLIDEFNRIGQKKSSLPAAQRNTVQEIVTYAFIRLITKQRKQSKDSETGE